MVFSDAAMENLSRDGIVVWLETPVEEIERRLEMNRTERGVAAPDDMTIADIYAQRRPLYEKWSSVKVNCLQGTDNVVAQIREELEKLK
jgi:shikimate kinase